MAENVSLMASFLLVVFVMGTVIIGLTLSSLGTFEKRAKLDSVDILASRMENTVYMVDALEEAEVQIKYDDKYNITREQGNIFQVYEADLVYEEGVQKSGVELDPPVSFDAETGKSKYFCIVKNPGSQPEILPEEC